MFMRMLINVLFPLGSLTMNLPINLLIRVNALNEQEELRKSVSIKCLSHEFIDVYLFSSFSYDSSKKHAFRTKAILLALVSDFYLYRKCTFKSFFISLLLANFHKGHWTRYYTHPEFSPMNCLLGVSCRCRAKDLILQLIYQASNDVWLF